MKTMRCFLISIFIFKRNFVDILLRCLCLGSIKATKMLKEMHGIISNGHFFPLFTTQKVIWEGFYSPTLFSYSSRNVRRYLSCQKFARRMKRETLPLPPILVKISCVQWAPNIIILINPKLRKGHSNILNTTYHFMKCNMVIAEKKETIVHHIQFWRKMYCQDLVFLRHSSPIMVLFLWSRFIQFYGNVGIITRQASNYYPKENGLADSTHKTINQIWKRNVLIYQINWHA